MTDPVPAAGDSEARSGGLRKIAPRLVASGLVALGCVWLMKRGGLPIVPPRATLAEVAGWALPLHVVLFAVATFFRTYRWYYLLSPLAPAASRWRVFGVGLAGSSATFFAPLRSGEVVRPYLISRDGTVSFFQATGTLLAERIVDGLCVALLTLLGLALSTPISPAPERLGELSLPVGAVRTVVYVACAVFLGLLVAVVAFHRKRELVTRLVNGVLGVVSSKLAAFASGTLARLAEGLEFLSSREHRRPFLRDTLVYWLAGVAAQFVLLRGCGLAVTFPQACVTLGVIGLGIVAPSGPGFFGAYQLSAYTALVLYFPGQAVLKAGSAYVFLSYVTMLATNLVAVGLGFFLMARFPTEKKRPGIAPSP